MTIITVFYLITAFHFMFVFAVTVGEGRQFYLNELLIFFVLWILSPITIIPSLVLGGMYFSGNPPIKFKWSEGDV